MGVTGGCGQDDSKDMLLTCIRDKERLEEEKMVLLLISGRGLIPVQFLLEKVDKLQELNKRREKSLQVRGRGQEKDLIFIYLFLVY